MSRKQATKDVPVKQHKEIIANAFRWSYIKKKLEQLLLKQKTVWNVLP